MPELPEVETTVQKLKNKITGKEITGVWTDWPKYFSKGSKDSDHLAKTEEEFEDCVKEEVEKVERRGKNILIHLSGLKTLLVHQKLSGHLLVGEWVKNENFEGELNDKWEEELWVPSKDSKDFLWNPKNRFIRLIFFFQDGTQMAFSDMRRFGKILCGPKEEIMNISDIKGLGPDPMEEDFNLDNFKELFENKRGRIKSALLDQKFIAGIGNIYSDEILWKAKIHPMSSANELEEKDLEKVYEAMNKVLEKAVKLKGTSIDDYRDPEGKKGSYEQELNVYQKEGEPCPRCGAEIEKIDLGSRATRFCPECQSESIQQSADPKG
ncbi:MAG: DNA-formamidopyrimidine glycosylase [Candidatus Magasanikbacteria bacterium]